MLVLDNDRQCEGKFWYLLMDVKAFLLMIILILGCSFVCFVLNLIDPLC